MADLLGTDYSLVHLTTLLTETSSQSSTFMFPESSQSSTIMYPESTSVSSPSANLTTPDSSSVEVGQMAGQDGSHHYPAAMLGFTAACAFIIAIMGTFGKVSHMCSSL